MDTTKLPQDTEAPAVGVPVERNVMPPLPERVFPVPSGRPPNLAPGPWMAPDLKPQHDGRYLRHWQASDDKAYSFWRNGKWHAGEFFDSRSDDQELPWRGAVLRAEFAHYELVEFARAA